jgi:tape measure domain-containing protein
MSQQSSGANATMAQSLRQITTALGTMQQGQQQATQTSQQLTQAMGQLGQALQQGRQQAQQFGTTWQQALSVAAGVGIATTIQGLTRQFVGLITNSLELAARTQELHRAFTAIDGSGQAASATMGNLFGIAQRLGVSVTTLYEDFRRFDAAAKSTTFSTEQTARVFEQTVAGLRALGSSPRQVEQALLALEQIMTKGRLSAEEYRRQLGNAVPNALNFMAQQFNASTAVMDQMIKSGLIPAEAAVVAFSKSMEQVAKAAGPLDDLRKSFVSLKNEIVAWGTAFGEVVGKIVQRDLKDLTLLSETLRKLFGVQAPGTQTPGQPQGATSGAASLSSQQFTFESSPYNAQVIQEAQRTGLDPGLVSRVVKQESQFNPTIVSPKGAVGLMQLMPETARMLEPGVTEAQLREPAHNIALGTKYLAQQMIEFKNSTDQVALALAAFNAGPGRVSELLRLRSTLTHQATYADIQGQLPTETQTYVAKILGPSATAGAVPTVSPTAAAGAAGGLDPEVAASYQRTLQRVTEDFPRLKAAVDELSKSANNFNNILGKETRSEVDQLIQKFVVVAEYFARFPQEAAKLPEELQKQLALQTQQVAVFQASVGQQERQRDLLKSQVEQLEQLDIRQRAQLVTQRQGPEEAQRYTRQATEVLQQQRLNDQPRLAGLTLQQQIADYGTRLQQLQEQANTLGAQIEEERVKAQRPGFEATLTRITTLMGRPDQSAPEQAVATVRQQFAEAQKQLITSIQELARHPALQDLQEKFQNALQGLGAAADEQAQIMYERTDTAMKERITQIGDQITQIRDRVGAAGLDPLATDLARIHREFDGMNAQLLQAQQHLTDLAKTASPEARLLIARQRDQLPTPADLRKGEEDALIARRTQDERAYIESLQNQMQQLQVRQGPETLFGPTRLDVELQQRTRTKTGESIFQGPEGDAYKARAQQLQEQIRAQERLNYVAGLFEQFGNSAAQAWTTALTSIADGTKSVSEAFRDMARSILQSLAQIAAQEGFKALISLGVRAIAGAAAGGITTGVTTGGGLTYQAPFGGGVPETPPPIVLSQSGSVLRRPTLVLAGESAASNPEYILNRGHMAELLSSAMKAAPSAGGQAAGAGVTIINVANKAEAEAQKAQQEAMGRQVVVNYILEELGQGESSKVNRMIRTLQR